MNKQKCKRRYNYRNESSGVLSTSLTELYIGRGRKSLALKKRRHHGRPIVPRRQISIWNESIKSIENSPLQLAFDCYKSTCLFHFILLKKYFFLGEIKAEMFMSNLGSFSTNHVRCRSWLADFHAALSHQSVGFLFRNWFPRSEWKGRHCALLLSISISIYTATRLILQIKSTPIDSSSSALQFCFWLRDHQTKSSATKWRKLRVVSAISGHLNALRQCAVEQSWPSWMLGSDRSLQQLPTGTEWMKCWNK